MWRFGRFTLYSSILLLLGSLVWISFHDSAGYKSVSTGRRSSVTRRDVSHYADGSNSGMKILTACSRYPELSLEKPCGKQKDSQYSTQTYLVNSSISLLYCPVPKCGWSSWKTLFYEAFGPANNSKMSEEYFLKGTGWATHWDIVGLSSHTHIESLRENFSSLTHKIVFVRDPYDRLVSAYRDKVLRHNGRYVRTYNSFCKWKSTEVPTFPEFIDCIITEVKHYRTEHNATDFHAGEILDIHWRPQTLLCNVCSIKYNMIGHFETMNEDMNEAIRRLKLGVKSVKINNSRGDKSSRHSSLASYYKMLNETQIRELQTIYEYDFELLDYDRIPPQ